MYDATQLNDMLVPELVDIADQLKISNTEKTSKADLIDKILNKQDIIEKASKPSARGDEKIRRKRTVKKPVEQSEPEPEEAPVAEASTPEPEPDPVVQASTPLSEEAAAPTARPTLTKRSRKPREPKAESANPVAEPVENIDDNNVNRVEAPQPNQSVPVAVQQQPQQNGYDDPIPTQTTTANSNPAPVFDTRATKWQWSTSPK